MKKLTFFKYQGTGNDFVMIDNRANFFDKTNNGLIKHLCNRRFGIGGDGLILLENDIETDFKMMYYNADGNESTMCGNGGRCIVAFARDLGIITTNTQFNAVDGLHNAEIIQNGNVALQMIDVAKDTIKKDTDYTFLFTGSPHHIEIVEDVAKTNVYDNGKHIRYSAYYQPGGTNVNFVQQLTANHFKIRTYERGVEDETLSCGTGATAAAITMHYLGKTTANEINIKVQGGDLKVKFDEDENSYYNVMLIGPATQVFKGEISVE